MKMTDCYYEKKDWRACKKEVSLQAQSPSRTEIVPGEKPRAGPTFLVHDMEAELASMTD